MKPIIMSTEDVRGILGGRKTMVRIPIRTPHGGALEVHADIAGVPRLCERCGDRCRGLTPPYEIGDVLWVRETWARFECAMGIGHIYRADDDADGELWYCRPDRWRSPVTMPREAARLFLRVKDVRVERLNQITNNNILREGFRSESCNICVHDGGSGCEHCFAILNPFRKSWDTRNAKRGYGWDSNPYVWVIEFERITQEEADE